MTTGSLEKNKSWGIITSVKKSPLPFKFRIPKRKVTCDYIQDLRAVDGRKLDGLCVWWEGHAEILVGRDLDRMGKVHTILHEVIHACYPYMEHRMVKVVSNAQMLALKKSGLLKRNVPDEE